MLAGAIARATAATAVHPLNVIKTIFQLGLAMPDLRCSTARIRTHARSLRTTTNL